MCLKINRLITHYILQHDEVAAGFPCLLESPGFFLENSRTWKVLENHLGPGKSWKLKLKVLESPGKISFKVMHFSSGLNRKQAASIVPSTHLTSIFCFMLNFLQWNAL